MSPDFRDLVDDEGTPEELERLRRVHDLLVASGPPPELPPELERAPASSSARILWLPLRRLEAALVATAAAIAIAFAAGYLVGGRGHGFYTTRSVAMHSVGRVAAAASIEVGERDAQGNWPLLVKVRGLRPLEPGGYYVLYLTKGGRPKASCGTFTAGSRLTTVRLSVPYTLKNYDGWVVVAHQPGRAEGPILLST